MLLNLFDFAHFDRNSCLASVPIFFPVWLGDFTGILPADNFVGIAALFIIGGTDFLVYALLTYSFLWFAQDGQHSNSSLSIKSRFVDFGWYVILSGF